jgi:hypothetical protein
LKRFQLYIYIIFTTISGFSTAQEIDFAPLQVGNVWVYKHQSELLLRGEVVDSALFIDSIKYYGLAEGYYGNDRALRLTEDNFFVMREDTTFLEPNHERKYYKKNAQLGDTWEVDYGFTFPAVYTIIDTFPANTFDTLVTGKMLNESFGLVEWDYIWTEKFGQLAALDWLGEPQYYLKGCVINGRVFGDTVFTVVPNVNDNISLSQYKLFQNYPNPFNNSTILSYTIPVGDKVLVEVYNLLGKKVAVLVDDFVPAGKHSVIFDAEKLSSGVYIYSFKTLTFQQKKKMLLIK